MDIVEEFQDAIGHEREWRKFLLNGNLDSGSYCESPSGDYVAASEIKSLYQQLADKLLAYNRAGRPLPKKSKDTP